MTTATMSATAAEIMRVNPSTLFDPTAFGYSQVAVAHAGQRLVFISGQGGADERGTLDPDFDAQVGRAFANLRAALSGAGASPEGVVKLTIFVVDHQPERLGVVTRHVIETFGSELPAQTLVPVPRLALDGMMLEVEAIAVLD